MDKEKFLQLIKNSNIKGSFDYILSIHKDYVLENKFGVFVIFLNNLYQLNNKESEELNHKRESFYRAFKKYKDKRLGSATSIQQVKKETDKTAERFQPEILNPEELKTNIKKKSYTTH
jgi:hypothetical protein